MCGKLLDLYFVQSTAKHNVYIISKIGLNTLRQIHGFPISLTNRRYFHSIAVEVGLNTRSSKKCRALRQNHDFFHARHRWKYSHDFAVLSGSVAEEFKCSSEFYGKSTANLWFPFSPCQSESTPISLLQTYRNSVFSFTVSFFEVMLEVRRVPSYVANLQFPSHSIWV